MPSNSDRGIQNGTGLPDLSGSVILGSIRLLHVCASGTYGVVYRAVDIKYPNTMYAVKCQWRGLDEAARAKQDREWQFHQLVSSHPNIVTMYGHHATRDFLFLILDFCPMDLFTVLTNDNPYATADTPRIQDAMLQLVSAVQHCHDYGVSHRDIKPENILLKNDRLLLTDFGLATDDEKGSELQCGSSFYMSPECNGEFAGAFPPITYHYNDSWALAVVFINIVCTRNPWGYAKMSDSFFSSYVTQPSTLSDRLQISRQFYDLLRQMLALNPSHRIPLSKLPDAIRAVTSFRLDTSVVEVVQHVPAYKGHIAPPPAPVIPDALVQDAGDDAGDEDELETPEMLAVKDDAQIVRDLDMAPFALDPADDAPTDMQQYAGVKASPADFRNQKALPKLRTNILKSAVKRVAKHL